jgi:hypothetical protein
MSDWFEKAKQLKIQDPNLTYSEIGKQLGIAEQTIKNRFCEERKKTPITGLSDQILKELQKERPIKDLCEQLKISERVLRASLEDLSERGFLFKEFEEKIKLAKDLAPQFNRHSEDWNGDTVIKFGAVCCTHLGNKWQQLTFLNHLYDVFEQEGIVTVYHGGDITDGFYKSRPGHIYELFKIGADEQAEYVIDVYPKRKGIVTKFITGNHDYTHIMNGGTDIGKRIALSRNDMIYLGYNNAKVDLTPNCVMEINHPGDGSSYAISYSIQKYIDSMSGGDKPNILLNGHHHKGLYIPYRNVHGIEMGTVEAQTPFMKSQRIAAMVGGFIIEVHVDGEGTITRFKNEFIQLYKPLENDYKR